MLEIFLYCILFGACAGILAGLFGIGGGLVIVPFLVWLYGVQGFEQENIMLMAVATSLATIIFTSIAAVITHHRLGSVLWKTVINLLPGILLGSIVGAFLADTMSAAILRNIFAVFMLYVGVHMALQLKPDHKLSKISPLMLGLSGYIIGVFSAILGIGGGTLTVPFLAKNNFKMHHAIAISSACGFPIALTGTLSYAFLSWNKSGLPVGSLGYIYLPAFLGIVATSVLMAPVGAILAHKLPAKQLKRYFSILLFAVAVKLLG